MPILNYTSTVAADKTISEIQKILGSKGATHIMVDYEAGEPSALTFRLVYNEMPLAFRLPGNWPGVMKSMSRSRVAKRHRTEAQARRTCWRIIKDWVEAQMAIIEAEQASLATVFLPYMVGPDNQTLAHFMLETAKGKQFLLNP